MAGMETRDPYLHNHSRRVARHAWMIAGRMGLPRDELARIRTAAAIHDVGKISTPKAILQKPSPLTAEEYAVIKCHPADGAEMAAVLGDGELTSMVRHHHERLDGSGYPDGLSAERIPLGARIIAVADTFDAITSARPYRPASPHKKAMDILRAEAGTKLDPGVVRAFCGHYSGRRPIAIWAFVAGLPERALSWLGGSVGSVASAAKMLAVAALVGGTTAATASLAQPAAKRHSTRPSVVSATARPQRVQPTSLGVAPRPGSGARARTQAATRAGHAVAGSSTHRGSPGSASAVSSVAGAAPTQPNPPSPALAAGLGRAREALTAAPKHHNGRAKKPTGKAKRRTARAKRTEKAKQPTARAERRTAAAKKRRARAKRPKARAKKRPGKAKEARAAAKLKKVMARTKKPTGKAESADLPRRGPGQARLHLPSLG